MTAYATLGPDSDICLITIERYDSRHRVKCWACLFDPDWIGESDMPVEADSSPVFENLDKLLTHVAAHQEAGHKVPADVIRAILQDDWLSP
jgi:hypothetical protein